MRHDQHFLYYGKFDVSHIIPLLNNQNDWIKDTVRQTVYDVFRDTNTIVLIDAPNSTLSTRRQGDWSGEDLHWLRMHSPYYDACEPIIRTLEQTHNGTAFKSYLTRLPAGASIPNHWDSKPLYHLTRRHHIPIVTNAQVKFNVNGEIINMRVGECWEISNQHYHEVINDGDTDRVHLTIDIFPNDRKDNCGPECEQCNSVRGKPYTVTVEDYYES